MKKTSLMVLTLITGIGIFIASCQSGDSRFPGYKVAENGLIYKFDFKSDSTVSPIVGDFVTVIMTYGKKDSIVFDSRTIPQEMIIPMTEPLFKGDIYTGIEMMHIGDSASFVMPADSVFKKLFRMQQTPPEFANDPFMYFTVKLLNIQSKEEVERAQQEKMENMQSAEIDLLNQYIATNYPDAQPTEEGLFIIVETPGKGPNPAAGQTVTAHYTGKFLDGTVFDSSVERGQPFEFKLGQGQVIPGWDIGFAKMNKGEKAVLVIPSSLAYGQGRQGIPPFSTLVFEVELIDFK
jgi:FKBP-type peptidyl-prolyl cis-trans isomerase FkpA